jgi:protein-S-isoprenylcysteine O-methyltransferase Ste14
MLAFFSWILFFPHWIIIVVSLVNIAIVYWFILQGEHLNIEKFGDAYRRYMEKVPRINILAGLFKAVHRKM